MLSWLPWPEMEDHVKLIISDLDVTHIKEYWHGKSAVPNGPPYGRTKRPHLIDPQLNADRAERRKRRQEIIDQEVSEKMKKFNEPGDTVENIFSEVEHTCTTQETEESDELQDGRSEDEEMGELQMDVAGEKLVKDTDKKPVLVDRDNQTLISALSQEKVHVASQTTEFDHLFCSATKTQPFTEDYFKDSDDR
ncbi:hypothetical protein AWC38_SpisGene15960 [Stylophora pistillata]|uniref:Uncharacterized protein n=1 Tax=Stylophora pistillata TaxID=50429 RepID=A0A2B4RPU2_STYPI|nr:hypothetical protein AWC38_SpisGene15960 [Stylophora pistillata]